MEHVTIDVAGNESNAKLNELIGKLQEAWTLARELAAALEDMGVRIILQK